MIFLMAIRNITRNIKNSFIIALFLCIITFLFFFGNTVIWQGGSGLKSAFVNNVTGDIVIEKKGNVTMSLFGANAPVIEDFFSIEPLPAYNEILKILSAHKEIAAITSQVTSTAAMKVENIQVATMIFGIDAESYFDLFPGIKIEEGRKLKEGESGAMLTRDECNKLEHDSGKKITIGTPVMLTAAGNIGFKIREVPLVGIFTYDNPQSVLNHIALIDVQTARVLSEIQVATSDVPVPVEANALINFDKHSSDEDDIFNKFSDVEVAGAEGDANQNLSIETMLQATNDSGDNNNTGGADKQGANNQSANSGRLDKGNLDKGGGDWNFILIKLKPGADAGKLIKELNSQMGELGALAVNWRIAAGVTAIMLLMLQVFYNAGMFIVCVAGIIAIVNILLISIFRRTREIGTLRAIGARDNYIRLLLITENCVLGVIGGIAGIILSSLVFTLVNMLNINIPNELLANYLGGDILRLGFYPGIAILSVALSFVISFLSLLFPVEIAIKIEPITALRQG